MAATEAISNSKAGIRENSFSTAFFSVTTSASGAELWCVFTVGAVLGCLVRWVYWQADFCWDDRYALMYIGLIETGRMPLWQFILEPWNAHWMPLWKLTYYLLWQVFGLHYEVYHFVGDMWHAAGVPALYGLTLFYFQRRLPALIAALLWSVACLGQWDDTLLLVYSQCNAGAMALFLWALYAQTRVFARPGPRWPIVVAVSLNLAFAMWGVSWLWSPVFIWQHFLLRRETPRELLPNRTATALCLVPVAVWGAFSVVVFLLTRETGGNDPIVPLEVAARVGGQMVTTLGNIKSVVGSAARTRCARRGPGASSGARAGAVVPDDGTGTPRAREPVAHGIYV
jgi:hypothetical protein